MDRRPDRAPSFGGSLARTEATGYGAVYLTHMLAEKNDSLGRKHGLQSPASGNAVTYAAQKAQLGATVVTASDSSPM